MSFAAADAPNWFMVTIIGVDSVGIVAKVTNDLATVGCNLGETSMLRIGGNFTIMMMVSTEQSGAALKKALSVAETEYDLHVHIDPIKGKLHRHIEPDIRISIYGADSPGIIAQVTEVLTEAEVNITNLSSDVSGTHDAPLYILSIEGQAHQGVEMVAKKLRCFDDTELSIHIEPIELLLG